MSNKVDINLQALIRFLLLRRPRSCGNHMRTVHRDRKQPGFDSSLDTHNYHKSPQ